MTTNGGSAARRAQDAFPIAAVGASAGGLSPTVDLLSELGAQPGLAIVVLNHLDPTHESGLVDILARASGMVVLAATEGEETRPGHVYVLPPNAGLVIERGCLRLTPRVEEGGLHLPIDRFFESLARDREGMAVAVVLSGNGFDGTAGVVAIKREGGIVDALQGIAKWRSTSAYALLSVVRRGLAPGAP